MKDRLFCVGQKAVINKKGKILVLHDPIPPPGGIDLPGGKIQKGEHDFYKALAREVFEETHLEIKIIRPFFTNYFEFPKDSPHRNRGKKIFLVYYVCKYVSGKITMSEEHDWYKWVDAKNYQEVFKRKNNIFEALGVYFNRFAK